MAKDDYHVIVYQILAYLYQCLKTDAVVDPAKLGTESVYFQANGQKINRRYWAYIIWHLSESGLISGAELADVDNLQWPYPVNLERCMITPAGIEYLTENSFIEKAKEFLKDIKAIAPFM